MQRNINFHALPLAKDVTKRFKSLPVIWVVPLLAVALGSWLSIQAILKEGPTVTMTFESAEGLETGKTKIRFKSVDIGEITDIRLSRDRSRVIVTADLVRDATDLLVKDTQFWVVKPRISGSEISGIGTLLSGSYITLKAGQSRDSARNFEGLDVPPVQTSNQPGRQFILAASDLGSLDIGSPIFYRHIKVGEITAYDIQPGGKEIQVHAFIHAPFDSYVTGVTRFWNASGFNASMDSSGIRLETEALVSILSGGIAFEDPSGASESAPADMDHVFTLFRSHHEAMKTPHGKSQIYQMHFSESLRGLTAGSTVEFQGIPIGEVLSVDIRYDETRRNFIFPVTVAIHEEELGLNDSGLGEADIQTERQRVLDKLISRGLRAQLRTGSLITGQLYIALEFFPDASPVRMDWNAPRIDVPTTPGTVQAMEQSLSNVLKKVEKMPLTEIGTETRNTMSALNGAVRNLNSLILHLDQNVTPETHASLIELKKTLIEVKKALAQDSPLQRDLRRTLRETTRSVQTIRTLADTLESEPESLLQGKVPGDSE